MMRLQKSLPAARVVLAIVLALSAAHTAFFACAQNDTSSSGTCAPEDCVTEEYYSGASNFTILDGSASAPDPAPAGGSRKLRLDDGVESGRNLLQTPFTGCNGNCGTEYDAKTLADLAPGVDLALATSATARKDLMDKLAAAIVKGNGLADDLIGSSCTSNDSPSFTNAAAQKASGHVKFSSSHAFYNRFKESTTTNAYAVVLTTGSAVLPIAITNTADNTGDSSDVGLADPSLTTPPVPSRLCFRFTRKSPGSTDIPFALAYNFASEEYGTANNRRGTGANGKKYDRMTITSNSYSGTNALIGALTTVEKFSTPYNGGFGSEVVTELPANPNAVNATLGCVNNDAAAPTKATAYDGYCERQAQLKLAASASAVEVTFEIYEMGDAILDSAVIIKAASLSPPTSAKISIISPAFADVTETGAAIPTYEISSCSGPLVLDSSNSVQTTGRQWEVTGSGMKQMNPASCGSECTSTVFNLMYRGGPRADDNAFYPSYPGLPRLSLGATSRTYKVTLKTTGPYSQRAETSINIKIPPCNSKPVLSTPKPVITADTTPTVGANGVVTIECKTASATVSVSATDAEGDNLRYKFVINGTEEAESDSNTYDQFTNFGDAAGLKERTTTTVGVIVSDGFGGIVRETEPLTIVVGECDDPPSIAMSVAGAAKNCPDTPSDEDPAKRTCYMPTAAPACEISLSGAGSMDPEGETAQLGFEWALLDPSTEQVVFSPPGKTDRDTTITVASDASSAASSSGSKIAPGTYIARLTVKDPGPAKHVRSSDKIVTFPRCNSAPRIGDPVGGINRGVPQSIPCPRTPKSNADLFKLDSSGVEDAEGDRFGVTWEIYKVDSVTSQKSFMFDFTRDADDASDPTLSTSRTESLTDKALKAGKYAVKVIATEAATTKPEALANYEWAELEVKTCNLPPSGELAPLPAQSSCASGGIIFDGSHIEDSDHTGTLAFSWAVTKADDASFTTGDSLGNSNQALFIPYGPGATVPDVADPEGDYTVSVTADDGIETTTSTKTFSITNDCNIRPVANLEPPLPSYSCPSRTDADKVILDGSNSYDWEKVQNKAGAEGIVEYKWTITGKLASGQSHTHTFVGTNAVEPLPVGKDLLTKKESPFFPSAGTYKVKLEVKDKYTYKGTTYSDYSIASETPEFVVETCDTEPKAKLDYNLEARCPGTTVLDSSGSTDKEDDLAQKALKRTWTIKYTDPDKAERYLNLGTAASKVVLTLQNGYEEALGDADFALPGEGSYDVEVAVEDSIGQVSLQSVSFSINFCNKPPTAVIKGIPADIPAAPGNFEVNGLDSADLDRLSTDKTKTRDTLSYYWTLTAKGKTDACLTGDKPKFTVVAPKGGEYSLGLTVSDGQGGVTTTSSVINLSPARLNCAAAFATPDRIWPPNNVFFRDIRVENVINQEDGVVEIEYTRVTQSEGTKAGSGKFCADAIMTAADPKAAKLKYVKVQVAPERAGTNKGRIYRIDFKATRGAPNPDSCTGFVLACVPHSDDATCSADLRASMMGSLSATAIDSCTCK